MLSDVIRTTSYRKAIVGNAVPSFENKTVMDVGAGNGVLSFFAVEVRERRLCDVVRLVLMPAFSLRVARPARSLSMRVRRATWPTSYSLCVNTCRGASLSYCADAVPPDCIQLVDEADRGGANPHLKDKVKVVKGKIEDYNGPQVDTLVSEPIGASDASLGSTGRRSLADTIFLPLQVSYSYTNA